MGRVKFQDRCGIYRIINPVGKIYIGQSIHIDKRWSSYRRLSGCKEQYLLYNSLKKYGVKNHLFSVLELCERTECNALEEYYINLHDTLDRTKGLNLRYGGGARAECGDSTREKLSKIMLAKKKKGMFSSKFEGVCKMSNGKWACYVRIGYKRFYICCRKTEEEANNICIKARVAYKSKIYTIGEIRALLGLGNRYKSGYGGYGENKQYSFNKNTGKYFVYAYINGKIISIRYFDFEKDAAEFGSVVRKLLNDRDYDSVLKLKQSSKTVEPKGVYPYMNTGKFTSVVRFNGKQVRIGSFSSYDDAKFIYDKVLEFSIMDECANEEILKNKIKEIKESL